MYYNCVTFGAWLLFIALILCLRSSLGKDVCGRIKKEEGHNNL